MKVLCLLLLIVSLVSLPCGAANIVFTKYPIKMLSEPAFSGESVGALGADVALTVIQQQGHWVEVKAESGSQGFVATKWMNDKNRVLKKTEKKKAWRVEVNSEQETVDTYQPIGRKLSLNPKVGNPDFFLKSEDAKHLKKDHRDCIRDRTIFDDLCLGMPNFGIWAVLGMPDENKKSNIGGIKREMWIYRQRTANPIYVFLESHRLSGWDK